MRKEVSSLVFSYAKKRFEINPARVSISAFYKGKRCIDTSNIDDKIFVDALMDVGILKDDTPLENPEVVKRAYSQVGEDYVVITIEELESPESSSSAS
jgi:Holliday junction resolvase RusA-like endonuclease